MEEITGQKILYCVLNWGLGHASRSIPIINKLLKYSNEIVLASDGNALKLLRKEFPKLSYIVLPGYDMQYDHKSMVLNMIKQSGKFWNAMQSEKNVIKGILDQNDFDLIISDNRFGCSNEKCYNIFITHQINILHERAIYSWAGTRFNKWLVRNYNEIWVPDYEGKQNLTGMMSHQHTLEMPVKYIGPQSRFGKIEQDDLLQYRALAIISGPEPQRTYFENILVQIFPKIDGHFAIVRGKDSEFQQYKNIDVFGLLGSEQIEDLVKRSGLVISRSGYSSIMDYELMRIKAILVPTPGQYEQLFLGKWMLDRKKHHVILQDELNTNRLKKLLEI